MGSTNAAVLPLPVMAMPCRGGSPAIQLAQYMELKCSIEWPHHDSRHPLSPPSLTSTSRPLSAAGSACAWMAVGRS